MKNHLNPKEVATLLGVSNETLRCWRRPARLPYGEDDPHYLPATTDPTDPRVVWYSKGDLLAFLQRNEKYMEKVIAILAPDELRASLAGSLPRSRAAHTATSLRQADDWTPTSEPQTSNPWGSIIPQPQTT